MSDDKLNGPKDLTDVDQVERHLLDSTAELLRNNSDALDAATVSRLHKARSAALEQQSKLAWNWIPMGGAVTAAALVTVALQLGPEWRDATQTKPLHELVDTESANIDDFELLASAADLELLEELEFYMWLDSEESVGV